MTPVEFVDLIFKGTSLDGMARLDAYGELYCGDRRIAYIAYNRTEAWECVFINDIYLISGLLDGHYFGLENNDDVDLGDQDGACLTASYILMKGI